MPALALAIAFPAGAICALRGALAGVHSFSFFGIVSLRRWRWYFGLGLRLPLGLLWHLFLGFRCGLLGGIDWLHSEKTRFRPQETSFCRGRFLRVTHGTSIEEKQFSAEVVILHLSFQHCIQICGRSPQFRLLQRETKGELPLETFIMWCDLRRPSQARRIGTAVRLHRAGALQRDRGAVRDQRGAARQGAQQQFARSEARRKGIRKGRGSRRLGCAEASTFGNRRLKRC